MSPKGLLSVAPFILIILVCVPNSLGKPTADRDVPETIEESVILPETIEDNEESVTLSETTEDNEESTTIAKTIEDNEESTTIAETIEESTTLPETNSTTFQETNSTTFTETNSTKVEVGATFTLTTFKLSPCPM